MTDPENAKDRTKPGAAEAPAGSRAERRARQAEALRANLRRRKEQARERRDDGATEPARQD